MQSYISRIKKSLGPGLITGIADDDPSGIATYAQTGVMFGLGQLWLALYSIPFMIAVQEMCGRIGMVTGKGLAGVIKSHYSRTLLYFAVLLLFIANTVNIGADLGAMATSMNLVFPHLTFGLGLIALTLFTVLTTVYIPYATYVKMLKWLALSIGAYIITAFTIHHAWGEIFSALITPHIEWNKTYLLNITAMLGTTISPYLFFWQASEEVEEELSHKKLRFFGRGTPKITKADIAQMRADTVIGMVASQLITFFIIITASATLHEQGITGVASATQMAEALRPFAGNFSVILFALGIVGTGLLAVPTLAGSAGYALAEAQGMKEGLGLAFSQARAFYYVIIISMLAGALVNVLHIDAMSMLYYSAAANGILAAPLVVIILLLANNKAILGDKTNSTLSNVLGWFTALCMGGVAFFTVISFFA